MNCEQFLRLVNDGDVMEGNSHLSQCPDCSRVVDSFQHLKAELEGFSYSGNDRQVLLDKIQKRIREEAKPDVEQSWFHGWVVSFSFAFAVFIAFLVPLVWPSSSPQQSRGVKKIGLPTFTGKGQIFRGGEQINIGDSSKEVQLQVGDRLKMNENQSCFLSYAEGTLISVKGAGEFGADNQTLLLDRPFQGVVDFQLQDQPFKVLTPNVVIGVRGTVIHFHIGRKIQQFWVAQGKIEWETTSGAEKGICEKGQGISLTGEKSSPLSASPLNLTSSPRKPGEAKAPNGGRQASVTANPDASEFASGSESLDLESSDLGSSGTELLASRTSDPVSKPNLGAIEDGF